MSFYDKLKFNSDGLVPAIIQDHANGRVLMMAWMNRASLESTIATGKTHFWSRSRQKFWMKGESSGHTQTVKDIAFDCDGDTLLIQVEQTGAACHEGYRSCFFRSVNPTAAIVSPNPGSSRPGDLREEMNGDAASFLSGGYLPTFGLILFGRGADFFSTWVATPNLALEGNPLAKKMGWKLGAVVNLALCVGLAFWPDAAVAATTASLLVAGHNFIWPG